MHGCFDALDIGGHFHIHARHRMSQDKAFNCIKGSIVLTTSKDVGFGIDIGGNKTIPELVRLGLCGGTWRSLPRKLNGSMGRVATLLSDAVGLSE